MANNNAKANPAERRPYPSNIAAYTEYSLIYDRVDSDRFLAFVGNRDALIALVASKPLFMRVALSFPPDSIYRKVFNILGWKEGGAKYTEKERIAFFVENICKLNQTVMMALVNLVDPDTYYILLDQRAKQCKDNIAKQILDMLIYGDKNITWEPRSEREVYEKMGLKGMWEREANVSAGQTLIQLGLLTQKEYDDRIGKLQEQQRKLARERMIPCPECGQLYPEREIYIIDTPYAKGVEVCEACAKRRVAEGTATLVGKRIVTPPPEEVPPPGAGPAPEEVAPAPRPTEIYTEPIAGFRSDKADGPVPLVVQFYDTSQNVPTNWSWNFGDGGTSKEKNPIHVYNSPGVYSVTLAVSNPAGLTVASRSEYIRASAVKPPEVAPAPPQPQAVPPREREVFMAKMSPMSPTGAAPYEVVFHDESTHTPEVITWDFGDGTTASGDRYPVHTYEKPGKYHVIMQATWKGRTSSTGTVVTVTEPAREACKVEITPQQRIDIQQGKTAIGLEVCRRLKARGCPLETILKAAADTGVTREDLVREGIIAAETGVVPFEEMEMPEAHLTTDQVREMIDGAESEEEYEEIQDMILSTPDFTEKERIELSEYLQEQRKPE
jgi:PKD repeat protein